jgi:hypothetical protein
VIKIGLSFVSSPALENRADGLQKSEANAENHRPHPRQTVCTIGLLKEIGKLAGENRHQDDVDQKHDNVKQDAAIRAFKELLEHLSAAQGFS